jgi:hypothetical protein
VARTTKEAEEIAGTGVTHLFGLYGKKSAQGERALRNDAGELILDANQFDFPSPEGLMRGLADEARLAAVA